MGNRIKHIPHRNPAFKTGPVIYDRRGFFKDKNGKEVPNPHETKKLAAEIGELTPEAIRAIVMAKLELQQRVGDQDQQLLDTHNQLDALQKEVKTLRSKLVGTAVKTSVDNVLVLSIDEIVRNGDVAILACTGNIDDDVQEFQVVLPVDQIIRLIKEQKSE